MDDLERAGYKDSQPAKSDDSIKERDLQMHMKVCHQWFTGNQFVVKESEIRSRFTNPAKAHKAFKAFKVNRKCRL